MLGVKSRIIKQEDDILEIFIISLNKQKIIIEEKDIIAISSKVLAISQGKVVDIKSNDYKKGDLKKLIQKEGGKAFNSKYCYLTMKEGHLIPNAGIDLSNIPKGKAVLWPENPFKEAEKFQKALQSKYKLKKLGVLITDSTCTTLRTGVTSKSIGYFGFEGVEDYRGKKDIYGRIIQLTEKAVADSLATVAGLIMGETNEKIPFVVIKDAPVTFTNKRIKSKLTMPLEDDLFNGIYNDKFKKFVKNNE